MKWACLGFLLTISYKSVLLAHIIKIDYQNTIDTVDDVLHSEMGLILPKDTAMPFLLATDPRAKVKELQKKLELYEYENGGPPDWVHEW